MPCTSVLATASVTEKVLCRLHKKTEELQELHITQKSFTLWHPSCQHFFQGKSNNALRWLPKAAAFPRWNNRKKVHIISLENRELYCLNKLYLNANVLVMLVTSRMWFLICMPRGIPIHSQSFGKVILTSQKS